MYQNFDDVVARSRPAVGLGLYTPPSCLLEIDRVAHLLCAQFGGAHFMADRLAHCARQAITAPAGWGPYTCLPTGGGT